jgi:hypothetical protein
MMLGLALFAGPAHAQTTAPTVNWYETSTAGGTENSATIHIGRTLLYSMACFNYDTSNPKVVMLFDAASVPANSTVATMGEIPLSAAPGSAQPSQNSITIAQGGLPFWTGLTFAVSTTGKTLTVDTTTGGNVHCVASYAIRP